jgi:flagellar basal body-associated protein FliL
VYWSKKLKKNGQGPKKGCRATTTIIIIVIIIIIIIIAAAAY